MIFKITDMSRMTKKDHFWEWFKRHNHEYLALQSKSAKETTYWLNELDAHLHAISKFLDFVLSWKTGQSASLVITAGGRAKHFKKVEDLVTKAPAIPGWTIAALEEAQPIDFMLEQQMQEINIDPREMFFSLDNDDQDDTVLMIYHPLCTPETKNRIYRLAECAVYNLLGERSFGNDIGVIYVENLSYANEDIEKLEALPVLIGMRKSAMVVDSQGSLVSMH
jgi:hypothetical protein